MAHEKISIELDAKLENQLLFSFLGEMVGVLTHDLNNYLMVVMGQLEVIKRGLEDGGLENSRNLVLSTVLRADEKLKKISQLIEVFREIAPTKGRTGFRNITLNQLLDDLERLFKKKLSYSYGNFVKEISRATDLVISRTVDSRSVDSRVYEINFMQLGLSLVPWIHFIIENLEGQEGSRDIVFRVTELEDQLELRVLSDLNMKPVDRHNHWETSSPRSKEIGLKFLFE